MTRFAVCGHVEWVELGRFSHVPEPGEIIDATEWFSEAAGSAAVAAVQLVKLGAEVDFFTALGSDWRGRRAHERLTELGVRVHAASRAGMQRWGFIHLDDAGERTISILGERHAPRGGDDLPWERLDGAAAVFVSGGDAAAMREARRANVLVATPRAEPRGVRVDALVGSASDRLEDFDGFDVALTVETAGAQGGSWRTAERSGTFAAAPLPGPLADAYGAGDTFAGGLTYGLGMGYTVEDALAFAARAAAANLTGRGPYAGQLTAAGPSGSARGTPGP